MNICTYTGECQSCYSGREAPSLKMQSFVFVFGSSFRDCAVQHLLRHCFVHAKWLTQAVESPHVHRSSVHQNCGRMCVSMGWIAAEKKPGKTGKQWCDRYECFYWPEECEIVCRSCFANSSNVHLSTPNPNNTVSNSFGTSNKVCYLPSPFLDKLLKRMVG